MSKDKIKKYLEETDLDIQSAKASFMLCFLVFRSYAESFKMYGVKNSPICCYISYDKLDIFYQILEKNTEIRKRVYDNYIKDKKSLYEKINNHLNLTRELDELWKEYKNKKNKKEVRSEEYLYFYKKFFKISRKWWHYGFFGEDKGEVVNSIIVPNFQKRHRISIEEAKEFVDYLAHPDEMAVFNQERLLFLDLCLEVSKSRKKVDNLDEILEDVNVFKKIDEYLKKFFWFKSDFYRVKHIKEKNLLIDIVKELKEKNLKDIKKEIKNINDNFDFIVKKKESIAKNIKLTKRDKDDIYFAKNVFYWFDQRKLGMMKELYYILTLSEDIANFKKMDYETISLYKPDEVGGLLKDNKKVGELEIKKRKSGVFIYFYDKKVIQLYYGKEGGDLFQTAIHVQEKEIKGSVASIGKTKKVVGRAKIVISPNKVKFEKGDILVTSMTRVEFVPIMRKAKAIVTNEGGMACHAAIVSREMGLPAIIGTRNATREIKDGDKIEMDMEKGIIRIL